MCAAWRPVSLTHGVFYCLLSCTRATCTAPLLLVSFMCCLPSCPQPVDLKVFIQNYEFQKYCNAELRTGNYTERSVALPGGWYQVTMPFSDFRCDYGGAFDTDVDRIDFQNTNIRPALFCLAGLKLLR